jgi:integrase
MNAMGRKPSRWNNLPKGMRARPRGNLVHYYLDTGAKPRKEIPLGSDYVLAVQKWAELTSKPAPASAVKTFVDAVAGYRRDVLPAKAPRTQQDNEKEFAWLAQFFGDPPAPLDSIEPVHVRQYMRWRVQQSKAAAQAKNDQRKKDGVPLQPIPADYGHVRANREKALFSHVWNYARAEGMTKLANPCAGIEGFHEEGRDTAPDEELVQRVLAEGDKPLQFAMRLADITGQRPSDVLRMNEGNIAGAVPGGILRVRQGKTGAKLRIVIEGALAVLLAEIREFKKAVEQESRVRVMALLVNEEGQPLTKYMLRSRFDDARARAGVKKDLFQFRDLRAKAATEVDEASGTRAAQALLGHSTEGMTADYIRHKIGKKVSPIR